MFLGKKKDIEIDSAVSSQNEQKRFKKTRQDGKTGLTKTEFMRRLKYGSLSTVLTVVFIVAVILANVLIEVVASKVPSLSIDTSAQGFFELSDETKEYIDTLKEYDIEMIFVGSKQTLYNDLYYNKICNLAENYSKHADNIKVSYVDIDKNPGFATNYDNIELAVGDAIVVCGNRYKQLTTSDFLYTADEDSEDSTSTESTKPTNYSLTAEYALTTSLMVVTASDNPKATVITGHGEKELEKLETLLKNNGYEIKNQSIFNELDYDSNILIISAPTKDYSEEDLKKLDDFLYNGGKYNKNVMYIADYSQPVLPNLEAFLYDWGIEVADGFVYETDSELIYTGSEALTRLTFVDPELTLHSALSEVTACGVYGKPATIAKSLDIDMINTVILEHTDTSDKGVLKNGKVEGKGEFYPYVAMARTTHSRISSDMDVTESSLLFVNSTGFFEDILFERDYFANQDITIAAIDSLLGRDNKFSLPSKNLTAASTSITYDQANVIGAIAAIVVPVLLLVACLFVYIRRRFS